jgi:hypothetical protein
MRRRLLESGASFRDGHSCGGLSPVYGRWFSEERVYTADTLHGRQQRVPDWRGHQSDVHYLDDVAVPDATSVLAGIVFSSLGSVGGTWSHSL